jgi:hypothetical protein
MVDVHDVLCSDRLAAGAVTLRYRQQAGYTTGHRNPQFHSRTRDDHGGRRLNPQRPPRRSLIPMRSETASRATLPETGARRCSELNINTQFRDRCRYQSWGTLMSLRLLALPALLLATTAAHAQQSAPLSSAAPLTLACSGPFAKDSSHAKLQQAFGAPNVAIQKVDGAEGETFEASVLYRADPSRRLEVTWIDDKKRSGLSSASAKKPSTWTGPEGIRIGMTLDEVAKLNGQPFRLNGFEWDYGGYVVDLKGKLASLPGGCGLMLRFSPGMALDAKKHAGLIGEKKLSSSDAKLLGVKPVLVSWSIGYAE